MNLSPNLVNTKFGDKFSDKFVTLFGDHQICHQICHPICHQICHQTTLDSYMHPIAGSSDRHPRELLCYVIRGEFRIGVPNRRHQQALPSQHHNHHNPPTSPTSITIISINCGIMNNPSEEIHLEFELTARQAEKWGRIHKIN